MLRTHRQRVPAMLAVACVGMLVYAAAGAAPDDGQQLIPAAETTVPVAKSDSDKDGKTADDCEDTTSTTEKDDGDGGKDGGEDTTSTTEKDDGDGGKDGGEDTTSTTEKDDGDGGKDGGEDTTSTTEKKDDDGDRNVSTKAAFNTAAAKDATTTDKDDADADKDDADKDDADADKDDADKDDADADKDDADKDDADADKDDADKDDADKDRADGDDCETTSTTSKGGKDDGKKDDEKKDDEKKDDEKNSTTTTERDNGPTTTTSRQTVEPTTPPSGGDPGAGGGDSGGPADPGSTPIEPQEAPPYDPSSDQPVDNPDPDAGDWYEMPEEGPVELEDDEYAFGPMPAPGEAEPVIPTLTEHKPRSGGKASVNSEGSSRRRERDRSTRNQESAAAFVPPRSGALQAPPGKTQSEAVSRKLGGIQSSVTESAFPADIISTPKVFPINRRDPLAAAALVLLVGVSRELFKAWRRRVSDYWPA